MIYSYTHANSLISIHILMQTRLNIHTFVKINACTQMHM